MAVKLEELTYAELKERITANQDTIVWPVGTLEAHGKHLPLGTDTFLAKGIAERIADVVGGILAPELYYGITVTLLPYPGGTRLKPKTYAKLLSETIKGFFGAGFRKVIIPNGHGGNTQVLHETIRRLTNKYPDRLIISFDWYMLDEDLVKEIYSGTPGHAGLDETAGIIYFRPDLVKGDKLDIDDCHIRNDGYLATPAPAPIVLEDGESVPDLDQDKATALWDKIIDRLISRVGRDIALWESNFGMGAM